MKNHIVDIVIFVLALAGIGFYVHKHGVPTLMVSQRDISSVDVNGKKIAVTGVKVEKIPQEVYKSKGIPDWSPYISGTKKHVLFISWNSPYEKRFRRELKKAFGKKGSLNNFYTEDIVVYNREPARCDNANCPIVFLMNHCGGGICIINPQTHEIIRDETQNEKQILPLLMGFYNWDKESLLN